MNIYGKRVLLRAMEMEDCEFVRGMFNDPEIENLVIGWAFPLSKYSQIKWYENNNDKHNFRFIIETKEDGAIGVATLLDIDWKNRMAQHGIKLAKKYIRGKGYGTDAVMAIMRYAFDELGLNRLNGSWFPENIPSKTMYMKCGWKEEGIRRNYIFKHGEYRDLVETGVLASDYYQLIEDNHYWDNTDEQKFGGGGAKPEIVILSTLKYERWCA